MTTYIVDSEGNKTEVLDREAVFQEGEKIIVARGEARITMTITSVKKVLRESASKYDVVTEIHVL